MIIKVLTDGIKSTCANTDNMGKLFPEVSGQVVTPACLRQSGRVFAFPACLRQSGRAPATRTNPAYHGTRTSHQYSQLNFCTFTNCWLRDSLYPVTLACSSVRAYGVTALWPRWHGVPGPYPVLSSGNTTSPYCRAVIKH
jgi:hypothetical protein